MSTSESAKSALFLESDSQKSVNQNKEKDRPFRVLSLDGGGMRGLYTATVLDTLCERFGRERGVNNLDLGAGFDLIVGTSTGGIIACGLAAGETPKDIVEFYRTHGKGIFADPTPKSWPKFLSWVLRNLWSSANSNMILRQALEDIFEEETLAEVYKRRGVGLCIPTVNLETQMPRVFKTPHNGRFKQRDNNWSLVDVCLATSAAPLLLPISESKDPDSSGSFAFVDGGLWANNPALIGLLEALSVADQDQQIEVFSVGTCPPSAGYLMGDNSSSWGVWQWKAGIKMMDTVLNVASGATCHMIEFLKPHLNREVTVVRLPETAPSAEQAKQIGIDLASPGALRVLDVLGKHDGDRAHSEARRNSSGDLWRIARLFDEIPGVDSDLQNSDSKGPNNV